MSTQPSAAGLPPETPIEALALGTRLSNLLKRADIHRVGELVLFSETGFLQLRHARPVDWRMVQQALVPTGLERASIAIIYLRCAPSLATLLVHQGIRRVGDLLALTEAEARALPGMSAAELDALQRTLAWYGLQFRDTDGHE